MTSHFLGEIRLFAYPDVPDGWLPCDGAQHSTGEYKALFAVIGTTYGGDGISTFAVPDLSGRAPMHVGGGWGTRQQALGESGEIHASGPSVPTLAASYCVAFWGPLPPRQ